VFDSDGLTRIIVQRNDQATAFNIYEAAHHAHRNGTVLYVLPARDTQKKGDETRRMSSAFQQLLWMHSTDTKMTYMAGLLCLTVGSPVVCKSNSPGLLMGVGNGTFATVRRVIVHSDDANTCAVEETWAGIGVVNVIFCTRPPIAVVVALEKPNAFVPQFSHLEPGEIPIMPVSRPIRPNCAVKNAGNITREQVPIVGGYAITDYAAQVIIDSVYDRWFCLI
jgi:hypothetical protein